MLTDSGRDTFIQAYDDLAASALRFLRETGGEDAVAEFARRRTSELEEPLPRLPSRPPTPPTAPGCWPRR